MDNSGLFVYLANRLVILTGVRSSVRAIARGH
jgi:hypothetical protein